MQTEKILLFTTGYGQWQTSIREQSLIHVLHEHKIQMLVDVRHSPCASDPNPASQSAYRTRNWHLQAGTNGIQTLLTQAGIGYFWLVELGNPQKNDPEMRILREHLKSNVCEWPASRGFHILSKLVLEERKRCCLLCACADATLCHRTLVANEFCRRYANDSLPIGVVNI